MFESLNKVINGYGLISGFAIIGVTMAVSYWLSARLTRGRLHGSAIAIFLGLVLSYVGGVATGGQKGFGGRAPDVRYRPAGRRHAA